MTRRSRTRGVIAGIGVGLLLASGCGRRAPAPTGIASTMSMSMSPSGASPSGAASASALPPKLGRLATPTSFELVAGPSGATLVWGRAERGAGALEKLELDAGGSFRGAPEVALAATAARGDIADLTAAWVKARLALAWLERSGAKTNVRAAWSGSPLAPFELGTAWSGPRSSRGNVVMAARGDKALVFARGDEAPCIDAGRHGCFAFGFHELEAERAVASGMPLSVPVPCSDNSTALAVVGTRFHYGVCTDSGQRPVTTLFSIQRDPDYARADTLLEGCTPAGTFVWRDAAWLVADCEGGRRAARIGDDPPEFLDLHGVRLECRSGQLRVRAPSLDLVLDEPRSALAPLLPPDVAPAGARAVWTGRALVVATSFAEELKLTRRTCSGDRLETTALVP